MTLSFYVMEAPTSSNSGVLNVRNIDQKEDRTPVCFVVRLCFFFFPLKARRVDVSGICS